MKHLKKEVKNYLKKFTLELIDLDFADYKYKNDCIVFLENKKEIGYLGYGFVSKKFSEYGSEFGMSVGSRFGEEMQGSCKLIDKIQELELSYQGRPTLPNSYFGFTSLYFLTRKFYRSGTASFYDNNKTEEFCHEIVSKVNDLYIPKIRNFLVPNSELVEDILDEPRNYSHPTAFIIALSYLLNENDKLEEYIDKAKKRGLFDSKKSKIEEILNKINR